MDTTFLTSILDSRNFNQYKMNLIIAKTGSGKTTAATKTIPKELGVEKERVLFLIDTNMGLENLATTKNFQIWGEKQKNKIYLMNYAKFGWLLQTHQIDSEFFDVVICDEFHNLYKYAKIDEASMWHRNPTFDKSTIAVMLARESQSYIAMETLKRWAELSPIWVFALTATPQQFLNKDKEMMDYIHQVRLGETQVAQEIVQKFIYTDATAVLTDPTPNKRLLFASTVGQAQNFANQINTETERKAVAMWSKNNETPMSAEQLRVRDYIIANEMFPDEVDDIVATEAYATGWNLNDEKVNEVVVHSGNEIIREQFAGRVRHKLEKLYIYDAEAAKKQKRSDRRKVPQKEKYKIPKKYQNVWLDTNDKKKLISEIGFPRKWTSLRKWLGENGWVVEEKHTKNGMQHMIKR